MNTQKLSRETLIAQFQNETKHLGFIPLCKNLDASGGRTACAMTFLRTFKDMDTLIEESKAKDFLPPPKPVLPVPKVERRKFYYPEEKLQDRKIIPSRLSPHEDLLFRQKQREEKVLSFLKII